MFDLNQPAYTSLRAICSERTSSIVVWVGAGLSAAGGLPTWAGLRSDLEKSLLSKAASFDEPDRSRLRAKLTAVEAADSPWLALQLLEDSLGQTSFRETIKLALSPALSVTPPEAYTLLWRLRPKGLLNLNLDRLATRAYTEIRSGTTLHEFGGRDAGHHAHVLKSVHPFVVNLHGIVDDTSSWVLTLRSLSELLENPGYVNFVAAALASQTVVFIGVTADDISTGGHLERLTKIGVDTGSHFWITNRRDLATDDWAEKAGIRMIRYDPRNDHAELKELLTDLVGYVPPELPAPPVVIEARGESPALPPPEELVRLDANTIRVILNAHAANILRPRTPEAFLEYEKFSRRYDQAIYRAWYVTTEAPDNVVMGYTLHKDIGVPGAFGRVFSATSQLGEEVAIKILHQEVRRVPGMLESFRRGVRSMKILSDRRVEGMVAYREASEIPALAVMDLVDGPNLKTAVESGFIDDWSDVLKIAIGLTRIIRAGHALPERVLHRDIRPANIMLKGYFQDQATYEVVVLDFDLSWHRGATEKSIAAPGGGYGYLAPEQAGQLPGVSTRNATVDSYGIGMTFLYMCTGQEPAPNAHLSADWSASLRSRIQRRKSAPWRSLPARFARLIERSTRHKQSERWDVGQIVGELEKLNEALGSSGAVESASLWAEEVLARTDLEYSWDEDTETGTVTLPSGIELRLAAREVAQEISLHLGWASAGQEEWKRIDKWLPKASDQAAASLRSGDWRASPAQLRRASTVLTATASVDKIARDVARVANGLAKAVEHLRFS